VYSETFTHLTGPHSVTGAIGRYSDAYDEYWFQVQVTELVGGVATLVPPKQGMFTDVIASGGTLVDLVD